MKTIAPTERVRLGWRIFRWTGRAISWSMLPFILLARKPPVSTLTWVWSVLLFPYAGPLAYFFFGSARMNRHRLKRRVESKSRHVGRPGQERRDPPANEVLDALDPAARQIARLLSRVNEEPTTAATGTRLLVDASSYYPALLARIEAATRHVHFETYIFHDDSAGRTLLEALIAAAARGIEVRLLIDQGGSWETPTAFFQPLLNAGGQFSWYRTVAPFQNRWVINLRNHRKLQVIDGEFAFVGGMNVGREYEGLDPAIGRWRDVQLELRGPVVGNLQRIFADDWFFATGERLLADRYYLEPAHSPGQPPRHLAQVISDGPDTPEDPVQLSTVALLNSARRRAWLTTGYFVPFEPLLTALKLCAGRGVDVRLLVAAKSDHRWLLHVGRSYYEELLGHGVRIFEYQDGMNHSKVADFDGEWLMVGSANFDVRSMRLNFELNVVLYDPATTAELERALESDYARSIEVQLATFSRRSWRQRALEALFRPLAPLL